MSLRGAATTAPAIAVFPCFAPTRKVPHEAGHGLLAVAIEFGEAV